jgi:hypothetical protein
MKHALIMTAAALAFGLSTASVQAAGPMSATGIKSTASSGSVAVHEIARKRVCRRTCVTKGWGYKKRRVCKQVCRWR